MFSEMYNNNDEKEVISRRGTLKIIPLANKERQRNMVKSVRSGSPDRQINYNKK